jgi:molybdopterin converting factor small subunit
MSVTVRIPAIIRQFTGQESEARLWNCGAPRAPAAGVRCFSERTLLYMNLYLNEEDVRSLANLETPVGDSDVLSIVFAVAGG